MTVKPLDETICLKQYLSEKDYQELQKLEKQCYSYDKTKLKLELDFKIAVSRNAPSGLKEINEFFYYVDEQLVAYLGISSFGGNIGEINGMTHPDYRKKGVFRKLFTLAEDELKKRSFKKVLLLADGKSNSGPTFIKSVQGEYEFSEYRMKYLNDVTFENTASVTLRKAREVDGKEIVRQNTIYFNMPQDAEWSLEQEESENKSTFMVELDERVIGKICVTFTNRTAYISGFGILPEFRGKGLGKSALTKLLRFIIEKDINEIELDVECKNDTALNLYKACGFEVLSVMNYYKYDLQGR
ncbi:GNAT family N-acetyltransferase [Anaerobacillus alkaliphilus]|uniref:GNAT family N-acetyltransferase n=1 Tax=Anaerobacillus alkaliphilus TaxID=1548597 RepID=A0A4Q0VN33_9BACI|nr:GNAT family N-acetyltransferase [Anaerobacillus alkaliphilus]RXI96165.1 GNAT family N-acetyltransferase [Anaerobacillus alkaliphilus]